MDPSTVLFLGICGGVMSCYVAFQSFMIFSSRRARARTNSDETTEFILGPE